MSSTTETIRRVEETKLDGLKDLDIEDVYTHIEVLLQERPGPMDLYRRWEQQQWSASALDFSPDKEHWEGLFTPYLREQMQIIFSGFFVGEYAVTDTLSPLLIGAPSEEDRMFLSTQVVDEARHTYFFARFFSEVIGIPGSLGDTIEYAKDWILSGPYSQIFENDLVGLTDAVRIDPGDYSKWLKGITVYHLMVEGILALVGQKLILRVLRALDLLPSFRAGFTAVTRDESRHVNYGVWALQQGIGKGYESAITETVDQTLASCFRIYANPERKIVIPDDVPASVRQDPRTNWSFGIDSLTKRLRVAGVNDDYVGEVKDRAWKIIWSAIDEYESLHGEDHPVRGWESGETQALIEAAG